MEFGGHEFNDVVMRKLRFVEALFSEWRRQRNLVNGDYLVPDVQRKALERRD